MDRMVKLTRCVLVCALAVLGVHIYAPNAAAQGTPTPVPGPPAENRPDLAGNEAPPELGGATAGFEDDDVDLPSVSGSNNISSDQPANATQSVSERENVD